MKHAAAFLAPAFMIASAAPAAAVPGGQIGTLASGHYVCELPGDASGPAGRHVPSADFDVVGSSSYRTRGKIGSYLLTGDYLVMTSGPHRGMRFHRLSRGFLRQVNPDGTDGELRCVLSNRNNG